MSVARRTALAALSLATLLGALSLLARSALVGSLGVDALAALCLGIVFATPSERRCPLRRGLGAIIATTALSLTALGLLAPMLGRDPNLSILPDAALLAGFVAQFATLHGLIGRFGERRNVDTVLDVAIATVGLGWAGMILITLPALEHRGAPSVLRLPLALAPLAGLFVVLGSLRLLTTARVRPAPLWCFGASALAALMSDLAFAFGKDAGRASILGPPALGWLISIALLAAAALGATPADLTDAGAIPAVLGPARAARLGLALAAGPIAEAISLVRDHQGATAAALALPTAMAVALVFARIGSLFRSVRQSQRELEARERYYRALVERVKDYVLVLDQDRRPRYASPALLELVGLTGEQLAGERSLRRFVVPDDLNALESALESAIGAPGTDVTAEVRVLDAKGVEHYCAASTTNLLADPAVNGLVVVLHDASESKHLEQQLRHQALHDALTGLPNRSLVLDRLAQLSARAARHQTSAKLLVVDLDGFKEVNDALGPQAGDELLRAVADRLRATVRRGDTVGRMGSDEFVILTEEDPRATEAPQLAERVLGALAEPFELAACPAKPIKVSASIGVASGSGDGPEVLMRNADVALHEAKAGGKHRYVVFRPEMHSDLEERLALELELHEALERDEFFLLYQPYFDLTTLSLRGVEALLRWEHPRRGTVGPDRFIAALESSGMIVPVGAWVLRSACRQAARWSRAGMAINVGINVSARQLDDGLAALVAGVLAETGVDPGLIVLEVTESVLIDDVAAARARLEALRRLGVRTAIDDFGTGYSSFSYLRQLPIDILKIDRSFVSGLAAGSQATSLVRMLVALGQELGLAMVAEGIEDEVQLEALRAVSCELGQGFLFARPMPPSAIDHFAHGAFAAERA
ncbi:MAG: EAL domain-containing protein [Actinomycetota bacterium]|nr:EAL domain-containing protein [Actinomycetota bacterium]